MKSVALIGAIFICLNSLAQTSEVVRSISPVDITDSTKLLFYRHLDSFKNEQSPFVTDSSLLPFRRHGLVYGVKHSFGRTGGLGCGYHEGDEPHRVTEVKISGEVTITSIFDFEDSTCWLSSEEFKNEKIKLYFAKGFPPLTTLIFFTGDQSSILNWNRFSRPKKIALYINNKFWTELDFEDCICRQEFKFDPIVDKNRNVVITLVIEDAYKGQDNRVAISEINFDGIIH